MSFINRQPTGWLGFLGIKNFGRNPATAPDVLSPVWDLRELYFAASRQYATANATLTGLGLFATGQVPPGQVWYMHAYSYLTGVLAVGNSLRFQLMVFNAALNIAVPLASTGTGDTITTGSLAIAALDEPIIISPGESLGVYVSTFAGAPIAATVGYCYTRLDA